MPNFVFSVFSTKANHDQHIKRVHQEKKFSCQICDHLYGTALDLKYHLKTHEAPTFICAHDNCNKSYVTHSHLLRHKKKHINVRDYPCEHFTVMIF